MLPALRDQRGRPNVRVRFAALLILLGIPLASAPLIIYPLYSAVARDIADALPGF